jgi:HEAT repeat protein
MQKTSIVFVTLACFCWAPNTEAQTRPQELIEKLQSERASERWEAADRLGTYVSEPGVIPPLARALGHADAQTRWRAARALGAFGPRAGVVVVALAAALDDEEPLVRAHAAHALGEIGSAAKLAVPALAEKIVDRDTQVRRAVVDAIGKIAPGDTNNIPILTKVLKDADPSVVLPALETLADLGERVVPFLIEALADKDACYWACLVLAEIGPAAQAAVPMLINTAGSDEPEVRMQALMALAAIGPAAQSALPAAVGALDDSQNSVRYGAAYAIGRIGQYDAEADKKLQVLVQAQDPFLQMVSVYALARLHPGDEPMLVRAVQLLVGALKSPDPKVRSGAVRALLELDPPSELTAPALVAALSDADPEVLANVADAAAAQGERMVPRLIRGLENPKLKKVAVMVVQRIGPDAKGAVPAMIKALEADQDGEFRTEVNFAFGAVGPGASAAVPALMKALSDRDNRVVYSACYALGKIGPEAGKEDLAPLRNQLNSPDPMTRLVAALALVEILPDDLEIARQTVPLFTEGLKNPDELVRIESARALGNLGGTAKSVVPALTQATSDPSEAVRQQAAAALQKIQSDG